MNLTSSCIEQLSYVPERYQVVETFRWQPGIWGVLFIFVACVLVLTSTWPLTAIIWEISVPSAALGFVLVSYEFWRRKNPTVLVKDGELIAVFRKGHLDLTLAPCEIKHMKAGLDIMIKIGIPLGACAVAFIFVGVLCKDPITMALGLACGASLASAAWTRFSCAHLRVHIKDSRWLAEETVLIPSSRLKELFQ